MRRIERERKNDHPTAEQRLAFAAWLRDRLTEKGYNLATPKAGGQARFAEAVGVSAPVISRVLRGESTPMPRVLEAMAPVLGVQPVELSVRAGLLPEESLPEELTPERIGALVGVRDPDLVQQLNTFIAGLRAQQAQRDSSNE